MNSNPILSYFIKRSPFLAIILLISAMTARIFVAFGVPGIAKFLHFGLAIVFIGLILPCIHRGSSSHLMLGLLALLGSISCSALLNGAGVVNIFLDFFLLAEPFLLLMLITNVPISSREGRGIQKILMFFVLLHATMAYIQFVTIGHRNPDFVKGFFLEQGAGHHVAGAVALTGAVYFFARAKSFSFPTRLVLAVFLAGVVVISDSKQVIVVFLISLGILLVVSQHSLSRMMQYSFLGLGAVGVVLIAAYTFFPALLAGTQIDRLQGGLGVKLAVFPLIVSDYESSLNWVFGLGPGHTVGRLAKILPDYIHILEPLGATLSATTEKAVILRESHPLSQMVAGARFGSSLWSPFYFWAGNWGDLGLLGCGVYFFLWAFVFRRFCVDDISKFFLFNVFVFGFVFGWLEEPGYILFVATLIGLNWQDQQQMLLPIQAKDLGASCPGEEPSAKNNGVGWKRTANDCLVKPQWDR